jgi:predicted O-methyltransferase YrrM
MFSIIIPTMWRFKPFEQFIHTLINCDLVGEILIYDNDKEHAPKTLNFLSEKVTIFQNETNLGVNPIWNEGIKVAHYDNICLMNDDIIFDLSVFEKVLPYLRKTSTGVVGLCPGVIEFSQPPFINGSITIQSWNKEHTYGFGCLMFINRKNYIPIPKELVMYFGDDFIFNICLTRHLTNYIITDLLHYTPFAKTTSTEALGYLDKERPIYTKKFRDTQWALEIFELEENIALSLNSDIKECLPVIKDYLEDCKSALELGVRTGISTRVFLNGRLQKLTSIDIEEDWKVRDLFKVAEVGGFEYKYIITDSRTYSDGTTYDMLFIDTNHEYQQLLDELEHHHKSINKYILMHDTFTYGIVRDNPVSIGLLPAILLFLSDHSEWKVKEFFHESNGILVLERINQA